MGLTPRQRLLPSQQVTSPKSQCLTLRNQIEGVVVKVSWANVYRILSGQSLDLQPAASGMKME